MRRVVVLRPEPGASETAERARKLGLEATVLPLFAIEPVAWTVPDGEYDGLLLTSANAVRHAGPGIAQLQHLPVYAVGQATAAAARNAGFRVCATGDGGVESFLASVDPSLRLLRLCGADRTEIAAADVPAQAVVYRARPLDPPDLSAIAGSLALIHSPRAGRRFGELVQDQETIAIAAISSAAAAAAGGGWGSVAVALQPTDDALLALAARLCNKPEA